jgi:hypothetical protein
LSEEQDPAIKIAEGTLQEGDILFLATDALSAWFLKRYEERKPLSISIFLVRLVFPLSFLENRKA